MKKQCVLASHNLGKIQELSQLLADLPFTLIAQSACNITPIEETGSTFSENALLKARHAARTSGLPAIADDSGLSVEALGGAPGVHSARYAGEGASDSQRIAKLLSALKGVPHVRRVAQFHCALAWASEKVAEAPIICEGVWSGYIAQTPKGEQGFGYDPIFFLESYQCTAAELSAEIKQTISHRAQAMRLFKSALLTALSNKI